MAATATRIGRANAQPVAARDFPAPLKKIRAGMLNVGYIDAGPINGKPVILLHGWPHDIYSYADVGMDILPQFAMSK